MTIRRLSAALVACATAGLLLGGCAGSAPSAPHTAVAPDIDVPDAFTPLVLDEIGDPPAPFRGSDGRYHLVYDLQLTNASGRDATLERIDVVDAYDTDSVVASFSGPALVDPDCGYGDCNRLRSLPSATVDNTTIPPQQSRALYIDFSVESLDDLPQALLHRVYGTGATSPAFGEPGPIEYLAGPTDISDVPVSVIAPPVRGDNWVAINGCCQPGFPHRSSLMSLNGKLNNSQRFAIDWKRTNAQGEFYTGDHDDNASYVDYGSELLAVGDGTVVAVLDGMAANVPGVLPASDPTLAATLTVENVDGNHIILDLGDGVYAMYAHLVAGSMTVTPGDTVTEGQVIGKLGNTGNTNASHLHFQLMDGPSLMEADSLPYELKSFQYQGQVSPELVAEADNWLSGTFFSDVLATPENRVNQMPLAFAVVSFP